MGEAEMSEDSNGDTEDDPGATAPKTPRTRRKTTLRGIKTCFKNQT